MGRTRTCNKCQSSIAELTNGAKICDCTFSPETSLESSPLEQRELILMGSFSAGSILAKRVSKYIGLGKPRVAFAIGFQTAINKLHEKGLLTLEQIDNFTKEYEEDGVIDE